MDDTIKIYIPEGFSASIIREKKCVIHKIIKWFKDIYVT